MSAVCRITDEYFRNLGATSFSRERLVLTALADPRVNTRSFSISQWNGQLDKERSVTTTTQPTFDEHVAALAATRERLRTEGWVLESSCTNDM